MIISPTRVPRPPPSQEIFTPTLPSRNFLLDPPPTPPPPLRGLKGGAMLSGMQQGPPPPTAPLPPTHSWFFVPLLHAAARRLAPQTQRAWEADARFSVVWHRYLFLLQRAQPIRPDALVRALAVLQQLAASPAHLPKIHLCMKRPACLPLRWLTSRGLGICSPSGRLHPCHCAGGLAAKFPRCRGGVSACAESCRCTGNRCSGCRATSQQLPPRTQFARGSCQPRRL